MKDFYFIQRSVLFSEMLLKYFNTNVIHQFLYGVSYVHRKMETVVNMLFFDLLNNTMLYSVAHDTIDPYAKVYSYPFLPFYISINYNTWCVTISSYHPMFGNTTKDTFTRFYHNCLIQDRTLKYVISNSPYRKLTSDFRKLNYLSIDIEEREGQLKSFPCLDHVFTDIQLTADHLCTFTMTFLGSKVICLNNDLYEIVFKDTEIIHSNPCNKSDSEVTNE